MIEWRNEQGQLHKVDGPAVEHEDGYQEWYLNGKRHRADGPAVMFPSGSKYWYLNDQLHRVDGPAIECVNGYKEWRLDGVQVDQLEHWLLVSTKETV